MSLSQLDEYFSLHSNKKFMLVHGNSFNKLRCKNFFNDLNVIHFTNFKPNPNYESVIDGVKIFNDEKCDEIIAVGGGSAIDVAKCIKFESKNEINFTAIPTTAGSGSEATQFAVVYRDGKKVSFDDPNLLPNTIYFDSTSLQTLPDYQKKSTLLDALCHAVESSWSIHSNSLSRFYSAEAIRLILAIRDSYIKCIDLQICSLAMYAAYLAGCAINITRTTAGHAMSYNLTSTFNIAHGHAVALCLTALFPLMKEFYTLPFELNLKNILSDWNLIPHLNFDDSTVNELATSVNVQRLSNNPLKLSTEDLRSLYKKILSGDL